MPGLLLRALNPNDTEMLYQHYLGLDVASKGCRFGIQISDYALRHFVTNLDLSRDIHFAVVDDHCILALAQVSKYSSQHAHRLELGISVATHARRQGYASLLWECATVHASACNMQEIYVIHSPHNKAMATFCRSKGLRMQDELGERVGIWTNPHWVDTAAQFVATTPSDEPTTSSTWPGILPCPNQLAAREPNLLPA